MKRENKTNSEETKKVWKKPQLSKLEELDVEGKATRTTEAGPFTSGPS